MAQEPPPPDGRIPSGTFSPSIIAGLGFGGGGFSFTLGGGVGYFVYHNLELGAELRLHYSSGRPFTITLDGYPRYYFGEVIGSDRFYPFTQAKGGRIFVFGDDDAWDIFGGAGLVAMLDDARHFGINGLFQYGGVIYSDRAGDGCLYAAEGENCFDHYPLFNLGLSMFY
ncbi:MAG: hypothetical protein ABIH03_11295 [Pseudomonadota bacterium]